MTNNFQATSDFLTEQFSSLYGDDSSVKDDIFYNVALIGRKKDNALADGKVKSYTIDTICDLDKYKQEIITICDALKVRAYISVNYKSHRQVALKAMVEIANYSLQDYFKSSRGLYDSVVAKFVDHKNNCGLLMLIKMTI